jgi:hypothetical protein
MPKLKKLEISSQYVHYDKVSFFAEQLIVFPELQILRLKLEHSFF